MSRSWANAVRNIDGFWVMKFALVFSITRMRSSLFLRQHIDMEFNSKNIPIMTYIATLFDTIPKTKRNNITSVLRNARTKII